VSKWVRIDTASHGVVGRRSRSRNKNGQKTRLVYTIHSSMMVESTIQHFLFLHRICPTSFNTSTAICTSPPHRSSTSGRLVAFRSERSSQTDLNVVDTSALTFARTEKGLVPVQSWCCRRARCKCQCGLSNQKSDTKAKERTEA
jgi:hypothetical protein